jgi:probable phosphoglycerate mutase
VTKIYFVRHGESEANLLHEISNRGFKHGLTERGFQQVNQLARSLHGIPFAQIYTSPIKRAFQTAEILSQALKVPLGITPALREFDCGELEGKSGPESWVIFDQVVQQWQEGNWDAHIPGGESHFDIQARFIPFIEALIQTDMHENILLVGHGGTYRCMFPLVVKNLDLATISNLNIQHTMPIIVETRPGGLYCTHWGEITLANS